MQFRGAKVVIRDGDSPDDIKEEIHQAWLDLQEMKRNRGTDGFMSQVCAGGRWKVQSHAGIDTIFILGKPEIPPEIEKKRRKIKKTRLFCVPAIEVYNALGEFKGIAICTSGTFDPPYTFYPLGFNDLDPFTWGQWKVFFETKPFEKREEKIISTVVRTTVGVEGPRKVNRTYTIIPNTAEEMIALDWQYNSVISTKVKTATRDYRICCMPNLDGDTVAVMYLWQPFRCDYNNTYSIEARIVDEEENPTGESIEGIPITNISNIMWADTVVHDCLSSQTHIDAPGECDEAIAILETYVPYHLANDYDPECMPGDDGPDVSGIRHQDYTYPDTIDSNYFSMRDSNFEDGEHGGMFMARYYELKYDYVTQEDVAQEATDEQIVHWGYEEWDLFGTVPTVYESGRIRRWREGVFVDGVFYEHRNGEDSAYSYADNHIIYWTSNPRYWNLPFGVYFGCSGQRVDCSHTYFFVDQVTRTMVATDFPYAGVAPVGSEARDYGNRMLHSIPGLDDSYGNGCFRLIKVMETIKTID